MRVLACALLLHAIALSPARADERGASSSTRWLVLPTVTGADIESLHGNAEAVRQELTVRGKEVWRADRASERFEVVGSAPAPEISQSDIDLWVERSRAATVWLYG